MAVTDLHLAPAPPSLQAPPPPMSASELGRLFDRLVKRHQLERHRLNRIHTWHAGTAEDIYVPTKVTTEYRRLVEQSHLNVLPLVEKTVRQALAVDGYRPTNASGRPLSELSSPAWDIWQANRMDSRQSVLWGHAIRYGWSYAHVSRGTPHPVVTPWSPRQMTTLWSDSVNDTWPTAAMIVRRPIDSAGEVRPVDPVDAPGPKHIDEGSRVTIIDDQYTYEMVNSGGKWLLMPEADWHGFGFVPVIRFPDEEPTYDHADGYATGKIEPLIPAQRQIDQVTYSLAMALQYSAFRQRYVTGMTVERHANGAAIEPFNVGVDRLLTATDKDAKFGEFGQTDVAGYLNARDRILAFVGSQAQIPPHNLVTGGQIANLSAEALASLQYGHRRDIEEHQRLFGEAVELLLRLCGLAAGNRELWEDRSARVHWADTTPRTLAEEADAYGKMATMLGIPPRMLWRRLRDVTDQELLEWEAAALEDNQQRLEELAGLTGELTAPAPAPDATGDAPPSE